VAGSLGEEDEVVAVVGVDLQLRREGDTGAVGDIPYPGSVEGGVGARAVVVAGEETEAEDEDGEETVSVHGFSMIRNEG
jgi:hypothetical protein